MAVTDAAVERPRRARTGQKDYVDVILAQWARERPDLDASPMGTIARIWRLARLSEAATEENFAEHGLSRGGFDVLAALRRAGPPYELSPTELYSSLLISSGAMTNRIDRLEEMGLVERIPDADDRRGIKVVLTPRGRKVIDGAVRDHLENERRMLAVLTPNEQRVLPVLLRELLLHFGDSAETAERAEIAPEGRDGRRR
jgi:DNA-binding MarR family transcriptional regulator